MRKNLRLIPALLLLVFGALLVCYPQESASAARRGLSICLEVIIPSLFPFFVFSSLFIGLGLSHAAGRVLAPLMGPLFHMRGPCAVPLLLGLVGGYPVGLRTAAQLKETGACSLEEARRLAAFCNLCGPGFLLSVAGVGIFASKEAGFLLLGTHWAAAVLVGILFRFQCAPSKDAAPPPRSLPQDSLGLSQVFPNSVRDSFTATLGICAFVIFFTVLIQLLQSSGLLSRVALLLAGLLPGILSPELCQSFLIGIFELSTGVYSLSEAGATPLALPMAAFIMGWGGLSVHCQSLPFLDRLTDHRVTYFTGKLLHGLLAAGLTAALAPILLPAGVTPAPAFLEANLLGSTPLLVLLRQEFLALWGLSGLFLLFQGKKGLVRGLPLQYNKGRY